jgi:hypothetical protein
LSTDLPKVNVQISEELFK